MGSSSSSAAIGRKGRRAQQPGTATDTGKGKLINQDCLYYRVGLPVENDRHRYIHIISGFRGNRCEYIDLDARNVVYFHLRIQ